MAVLSRMIRLICKVHTSSPSDQTGPQKLAPDVHGDTGFTAIDEVPRGWRSLVRRAGHERLDWLPNLAACPSPYASRVNVLQQH